MNIEQQRAIALAQARLRLSQQEPETVSSPEPQKEYGNYTPVRTALQGATLGFGDEIQAGMAALGAKGVDKVQGLLGGQEVLADQSIADLYKQSRDELRDDGAAFSKENPKTALGLELAGGLTTSGLAAGKNVAAKTLPTLLKRGAATGGVAGLGYSEADNAKDMALDTVKGAGTGLVVGGLTKPVSSLAQKGAGKLNEAVKKAADSTLQTARRLGYKVNPSQANPSTVNRTLEGLSGQAKNAQNIAVHNQEITNKLAKKAIGIKESDPLTIEAMEKIRDDAGRSYQKLSNFTDKVKADSDYYQSLRNILQPFEEVASDFSAMDNVAIRKKVQSFAQAEFSPKSAVRAIKQLRKSAKTRLKSLDDPEKVAMGKAEREIANSLEGVMERNLIASGKKELLSEFRKARELIAKTYSVEDAFNEGSKNVNAHKLAKALEKGAPLSGELKDIAKFAQSYRSVTQDLTRSSGTPSWFDLMTGMGAVGVTQKPSAIGAIMARPLVRGLIKSSPYQGLMTQPVTTNMAAKTLDKVSKIPPEALIRMGVIANERPN